MRDKLEGEAMGGRVRREPVKATDQGDRPKETRRRPQTPEVADDLAAKFLRVGNRLYRSSDDRMPIVRLEPDRLKTRNIDALPDIVRIARANGWTAIRIEGGDTFKKAAFLAAAAQGLDVENYVPAKRLKAEADRLRERFARREAERSRKSGVKAIAATDGATRRQQTAERFLRQSPEENARDPALKAAQTIVSQTLAIAKVRYCADDDRTAREVEAKRREVAARIASGDKLTGIDVRDRSASERRSKEVTGRTR